MERLIREIPGRDRSTPAGFDRRKFLTMVGKGVGLATMSTTTLAALLNNVHAAARRVEHLTPDQAASNEDFWLDIQQAFSVTRGITNLNNGGVSPSPRIVTEALVRYIWEQEDATAYTMWQILEPQSETIRAGRSRTVRLRPRRNRHHPQRFGVARESAHGHGLQIWGRNSHYHPGLSAHAHHVASAGKTRKPQAQAHSNSD